MESYLNAKSLWSCLIRCDPMDCSLPGSSFGKFSRPACWSGWPCPPPGGLPIPETEPVVLRSLLHWQVGSLPRAPPGKPYLSLTRDHPLKIIYLLGGRLLGIGNKAMNKVDKTPALKNFPSWRVETDILKVSGKILGGGGGFVARLCLTLCDPRTVTHQAPLPMGFSRQEHWSRLPFPSPVKLLK